MKYHSFERKRQSVTPFKNSSATLLFVLTDIEGIHDKLLERAVAMAVNDHTLVCYRKELAVEVGMAEIKDSLTIHI